jgi:hypothetical protein
MLLKYPEFPEPLVEWHQKHVVSEGVGPIWHRQTHSFAGHQAAKPNENERRQCSDNGEPAQPRVILRSCRHQKPKQISKKQVFEPVFDLGRAKRSTGKKTRQLHCEMIHNLLFFPPLVQANRVLAKLFCLLSSLKSLGSPFTTL